jgi:hypothetical protein
MAFYTLKGAEMGVLQAAWIKFKKTPSFPITSPPPAFLPLYQARKPVTMTRPEQ